MTTANQTVDTSDIDSLLDGTLDDLSDIPAFKPFPIGAHRVTINWLTKKINEKTAIELKLTAVETLELANTTTDEPVKAGDSTTVMYMFYKKDGKPNEIAQGQFKEVMKALAGHFGAKSNRELMAESEGYEVVVATGIRVDKRDANDPKPYTEVKNLIVA